MVFIQGKDTTGKNHTLVCNASGVLATNVTIGDVEIGAVELKDGTSDTRIKVGVSTTLSGGNNAIPVVNLPHTIEATLLSSVTAVGSGTALNVLDFDKFTIHVTSTSVTSGGTVIIQSSNDGTNYATIATLTITSDMTNEIAIERRTYKYLKASITSRTDGTYTVTLVGGM